MSYTSSWRSKPLEGLEFRNQECGECRTNAVLKIFGSAKNPRKAYFKCQVCNVFVMWLTEEHVVVKNDIKGFNEGEMKQGFMDLKKMMKFLMKLNALMFIVLLIIVVFKS